MGCGTRNQTAPICFKSQEDPAKILASFKSLLRAAVAVAVVSGPASMVDLEVALAGEAFITVERPNPRGKAMLEEDPQRQIRAKQVQVVVVRVDPVPMWVPSPAAVLAA